MVDGELRDMELLFKMKFTFLKKSFYLFLLNNSELRLNNRFVLWDFHVWIINEETDSTSILFICRTKNLSCSLDWLQITTMKMDRGQLTFMGSTVCVMLTLHFSIQLLTQHLMCWKKPKEQKAIIIIILMAPLYAIDSFVGLLDILGSEAFFTFLDSVKECYEALVRILPLLLFIYLCFLLEHIHFAEFVGSCKLGDGRVLGSDVHLLEHIHKQKHCAWWNQRKRDSPHFSYDSFLGMTLFFCSSEIYLFLIYCTEKYPKENSLLCYPRS